MNTAAQSGFLAHINSLKPGKNGRANAEANPGKILGKMADDLGYLITSGDGDDIHISQLSVAKAGQAGDVAVYTALVPTKLVDDMTVIQRVVERGHKMTERKAAELFNLAAFGWYRK